MYDYVCIYIYIYVFVFAFAFGWACCPALALPRPEVTKRNSLFIRKTTYSNRYMLNMSFYIISVRY